MRCVYPFNPYPGREYYHGKQTMTEIRRPAVANRADLTKTPAGQSGRQTDKAAAAAIASSVPSSPASVPKSRGNLAIIGGGAGGIAAAYCLHSDFDIDMFEARKKIGGHCDSETVDHRGISLRVDLGAQFFHPDTHPIYVALLEELGLYDPKNPDADKTLEAPGSIGILKKASGRPRFSSKHPYLSPLLAIDFAIYTRRARKLVRENGSWETTLEGWVDGLPVSRRFKEKLLYPWLTAAIGTTLENAKRSSARSILQTFALAFPSNIAKGASTFNSELGLGATWNACSPAAPGSRCIPIRPCDPWRSKTGTGPCKRIPAAMARIAPW